MEINEVKAALGKRVRFWDERLRCDGVYVLTGCIIRRSEKDGFYYQAELLDTRNMNTVCITELGRITLEEERL